MNWEQLKIERIIKRDKIIELRKQFKSYREIGEILGLTKQRVHQLLKEIRGDNPYRQEILERDDFKCTICDSEKNLEVHHINGRNIENSNNLGNLATVCKKCHQKIHTAERQTIKPTEIRYYKNMPLESKFRTRVIEEYNKVITETRHPSYTEIAAIVGCSKMTVAVFVREYRASLGKDAQ